VIHFSFETSEASIHPSANRRKRTAANKSMVSRSKNIRGGETPAQTQEATVSSWTKFRQTLFPIYGNQEVTKFLLIGSIKFFIILALTLTRDAKDTLVVTQCGAEAIAFLKV
jgi:AAA family ATP:ADP antiporter